VPEKKNKEKKKVKQKALGPEYF